jgi:serine/threonine protein kinase
MALGRSLTRAALASRPRRRLHAGRNLSKAVVDLVEIDGRAIVLKDLSPRPWPVRLILGPWQLDREWRAYRALAGVRGTPAFVARIDRQAIAIEYVPGKSLASFRTGELQADFFDRLDRLLEAIHARGVAHGDLHRHDVLAGPGGEPYLVDFSTSVAVSPTSGRLSRFLFRQMCRADLRSAAKLRHRLLAGSGGTVPPRPALYRVGRWARRAFHLLRHSR